MASTPTTEGKSIHGCAIVLGSVGLFVQGPSGSGKSALAQFLIDQWKASGRYACWVADDRVIVECSNQNLLTRPHPAIAGKVEHRFAGITKVDYLPMAIMDLLVDLKPADELERLPEPGEEQLLSAGPLLPRFCAPAHDVSRAGLLVSTFIQRHWTKE